MSKKGDNEILATIPPPRISATNREKEIILNQYKQRVLLNVDPLINAQLTLAKGQTFLFKITKTKTPSGQWQRGRATRVTDEMEISMFLDGQLATGSDPDDTKDPNPVYYYITAQEPSLQAIDSMLDRTFGRATQSVDITSQGKPTPIFANIIQSTPSTQETNKLSTPSNQSSTPIQQNQQN